MNGESGIVVVVHSISFRETSGLAAFSFSDPDRIEPKTALGIHDVDAIANRCPAPLSADEIL
jgi:hypothetical protein